MQRQLAISAGNYVRRVVEVTTAAASNGSNYVIITATHTDAFTRPEAVADTVGHGFAKLLPDLEGDIPEGTRALCKRYSTKSPANHSIDSDLI